MDSFMDIDDSAFKAEVAYQNAHRVPSPLGKRSRADFEIDNHEKPALPVQNAQQKSPSNLRSRMGALGSHPGRYPRRDIPFLQARLEHIQRISAYYNPPPEPVVRRIGGFITSLCSRSRNFVCSIWTYLTSPKDTAIEITAVETDPSGRKRRAVSGEIHSLPLPPSPKSLPGSFPEPSMAMTPPDSRPGSAQESERSGELSKESADNGKQRQDRGETLTDSSQEAQPMPRTLPQTRDPANTAAPGPAKSNRIKAKVVMSKGFYDPPCFQYLKNPGAQPYRPRLPADVKIGSGRAREAAVKERNKDKEIEQLIDRAREVKLGPPEVRKAKTDLRASYVQRKAAERAEKERKERAAREEKAKQKADQEAKEEAEREAFRRAEEEAAREKAQPDESDDIEVPLIEPLKPEWAEKVKAAMATKNPHAILATSVDGVELSRYDLGRILPTSELDHGKGLTSWLNDEGVNAWFAAIVARRKAQAGYVKGAEHVPPVEAYNTAWYPSYKAKGGVDGLRSWSRRKGIQGARLLRADTIFFPINAGSHWTLLVVSPRARSLAYLDSLRGPARPFLDIARAWLEMELREKYVASEWTELPAQSERQTNMNDCGVFACMNGLASAKGVPFEAVRADRMDLARRLMVAVLLNGGLKDDFEL